MLLLDPSQFKPKELKLKLQINFAVGPLQLSHELLAPVPKWVHWMKKTISVTKLTVMVLVKSTASEWDHRCITYRTTRQLRWEQAMGIKYLISRQSCTTSTGKRVRWPRGAEITVDLFYTLKMKSTLPVVGLLVRRGRVLFCSCASNKHYLYGN